MEIGCPTSNGLQGKITMTVSIMAGSWSRRSSSGYNPSVKPGCLSDLAAAKHTTVNLLVAFHNKICRQLGDTADIITNPDQIRKGQKLYVDASPGSSPGADKAAQAAGLDVVNVSGNAGLNIDKAVNYLDSHAGSPHGACAEYVDNAIKAGGGNPVRIIYAKNYGPHLVARGYKKLSSSTKPRKGDIVVIQPAEGVNGKYGDIAMFDGTHWVSDHIQSHAYYTPGSPYAAIYRP